MVDFVLYRSECAHAKISPNFLKFFPAIKKWVAAYSSKCSQILNVSLDDDIIVILES